MGVCSFVLLSDREIFFLVNSINRRKSGIDERVLRGFNLFSSTEEVSTSLL